MSDLTPQDAVRDLAVIAALKKILTKREAELKATFTSTRTTVYANTNPDDPMSPELGNIQVKRPTQPAPRVFDEDQAVAWAFEHFGESAMDARPRLSETGRADVIAAAKRGVEVKGVEIPEPRVNAPTYTALALAAALASKVAVIDTERGSASKYVGLNGWAFDTVQPAKFSPTSLVETLGAAAGAGYEALIVDSLSHYWMGVDGMLEQADRRAKNGNTFSGWKEVRPDERRMIDALVSFPGHLIVTMRSKTEFVIEENDRGKKVPRKVGLKPEQREGIEYEFDLVGDLDHDNTLTVVKSRIHTLARAVIAQPGEDLAHQIAEWLSDGTPVPTVGEYRRRVLESDDREELRVVYDELLGHRLDGAPTTDADGTPTTLGDLVMDKARSLRDAS